jgi:hypothetical protein
MFETDVKSANVSPSKRIPIYTIPKVLTAGILVPAPAEKVTEFPEVKRLLNLIRRRYLFRLNINSAFFNDRKWLPAFCKLELTINWNSFSKAFTQICHSYTALAGWTPIPEADATQKLFSSYAVSDLSWIIHKYVMEPSCAALQSKKYEIGYSIPYQRCLYQHVPIGDTSEVSWVQNSRDITSLSKVIIALRRESDLVDNVAYDHFNTFMGGRADSDGKNYTGVTNLVIKRNGSDMEYTYDPTILDIAPLNTATLRDIAIRSYNYYGGSEGSFSAAKYDGIDPITKQFNNCNNLFAIYLDLRSTPFAQRCGININKSGLQFTLKFAPGHENTKATVFYICDASWKIIAGQDPKCQM